MFNFDKKPHDTALDDAISSILTDLNSMTSDDPRYAAMSDQLVKLLKLKKEINPSWRPSPDALVGLVGTLITTVLVLNYEKLGVVTSKAFTFIGKLK